VKKPCYLQPLHTAIIEHGVEQLNLFDEKDRRLAAIAAQYLADERVDPIYAHPGLCLTVLPHREIPAGKVWIRQTGYASLRVHPFEGHDGRMRGVPYGPKARLILLYLMTEAVKTRSREVELGRSMRSWLNAMGLSVGGKNYRTVADQADRIEHCLLSFQLSGQGGELTVKDSIIRGAFKPFNNNAGDHTVELSEGFFQAVMRRPVPIAEGAVRMLADTCMPLDLYLWLAYRLHSLDRPTSIPWRALYTQFGAATQNIKHFKPRFQRDIRVATAVYPEAKVKLGDEGIILYPSPSPIPPRPRLVAKVQTGSRNPS
jgi:hypothetical protein